LKLCWSFLLCRWFHINTVHVQCTDTVLQWLQRSHLEHYWWNHGDPCHVNIVPETCRQQEPHCFQELLDVCVPGIWTEWNILFRTQQLECEKFNEKKCLVFFFEVLLLERNNSSHQWILGAALIEGNFT